MTINQILVDKKDYKKIKEDFEGWIKNREEFISVLNQQIEHYETHYMYNSILGYKNEQINDCKVMKDKLEKEISSLKYHLNILTLK